MFSLQASHQHGVAGTLESRSEAGGFPGTDGACAGHVVAHTLRSEGADASEDGTGRGTPLVVAFSPLQGGRTMPVEEYAPTLEAGTGNKAPGVLAFNWQSGGDVRQDVRQDYSGSLHVGQTPAVFSEVIGDPRRHDDRHRGWAHPTPTHPTLPKGDPMTITAPTAIPRRLTPRECERLQGWPDDWTRHGRTPDGEVIQLSDSARYRMAGNGVSSPVAKWIGHRLMAHATQPDGEVPNPATA